MNQLAIFAGVEENKCDFAMVKIVIWGGTLLDKEEIIKNREGSSLKSRWL